MTIFETKVNRYGENAAAFKEENMVVLFGNNAPADLADFCYIIDINPINGEIEVGDILSLDDTEYSITAVGNVVKINLTNLGHITLNFNGETEAEIAGTLYVERKGIVNLEEGSVVKITKKS
ncbi:hypothetical protein CAR_c14410 [Carnobacterium sp. 17-4]|uniref:PTS glucitol/sorbitol transporter subunit IIA n=1 Tax=Carnobacterium sp. (strain 17-4) TaxID=208596 RepID=UPI0002058B01|nr:PTS glucitol/sorbitol transporter subunit IIA [Carnobacterium sp. 17-4]AEB30102.1 hypothetical protein CAR_c14410 [Carnobacterium sp. 17-4]